eukprot:6489689-Amphidinium_carterae.6
MALPVDAAPTKTLVQAGSFGLCYQWGTFKSQGAWPRVPSSHSTVRCLVCQGIQAKGPGN